MPAGRVRTSRDRVLGASRVPKTYSKRFIDSREFIRHQTHGQSDSRACALPPCLVTTRWTSCVILEASSAIRPQHTSESARAFGEVTEGYLPSAISGPDCALIKS